MTTEQGKPSQAVAVPAAASLTATEAQALAKAAPPKAPLPPIVIGNRGIQLNDLDGLVRFSAIVSQSGLAPKGMDSQQAITIAIQMGLEVGLAPMQAIQNIAVVGNRPSLWGDAVKGLILASGECRDFAEWFEGNPYENDFTAHCEVVRAGYPRPVKQTFSVADAKMAGLWGGNVWAKYPKRMLQMRARGYACRDAFPDVTKGIPMAEDLRDGTSERDVYDITADEITKPTNIHQLAAKLEAEADGKPVPSPEDAPTGAAKAKTRSRKGNTPDKVPEPTPAEPVKDEEEDFPAIEDETETPAADPTPEAAVDTIEPPPDPPMTDEEKAAEYHSMLVAEIRERTKKSSALQKEVVRAMKVMGHEYPGTKLADLKISELEGINQVIQDLIS